MYAPDVRETEAAPRTPAAAPREEAAGSWAPPGELREVDDVDRLAYSRKQAAEALGVSISTSTVASFPP